MIPDEAVEAAARFLGDVIGTGVNNWEWHTDGARELLELVAPHLMAAAWEEGWDAFSDFDPRPAGPYPTNPYRKPDDA